MILYLDCANGVSGDMLAAALLDLAGARPGTKGPLERVVRPALKAAGIDPRLVRIETVMSAGIEALSFRVADAPGFATFDELILAMYASGVDQGVADDVAAVAERMAAAEREVHGEDQVHLHELSGVDTAADLISVAVLLRHLGAERVLASPPALGDGVVHTAHGELPVPAPAVAVLAGPTCAARAEGAHPAGELTTPTGAALLAHFAAGFGEAPAGDVIARGCGAGSRVLLDRANVLRAALIEPTDRPHDGIDTARTRDDGETETPAREDDATPTAADAGGPTADAAAEGPVERSDPAREPERETEMAEELPGKGAGERGPDGHVLLETNVDDMSPELLAHAADVLREAGAVDVWMTPAVMKKGRQGTVLHVLAVSADRDRLAAALFAETSTFGLRVLPVERIYAEERRETITVAGRTIGVRLGFVDGRLVTVSPEYEDVRAVAAAVGRPAKVVYEAAQALARNRFSAG